MINIYRHKLFGQEVDTVIWNGENYNEIAEFLGVNPLVDIDTGKIYFKTKEDQETTNVVDIGSYIFTDDYEVYLYLKKEDFEYLFEFMGDEDLDFDYLYELEQMDKE